MVILVITLNKGYSCPPYRWRERVRVVLAYFPLTLTLSPNLGERG
jgi:hypothetical protein